MRKTCEEILRVTSDNPAAAIWVSPQGTTNKNSCVTCRAGRIIKYWARVTPAHVWVFGMDCWMKNTGLIAVARLTIRLKKPLGTVTLFPKSADWHQPENRGYKARYSCLYGSHMDTEFVWIWNCLQFLSKIYNKVWNITWCSFPVFLALERQEFQNLILAFRKKYGDIFLSNFTLVRCSQS